MDQPTFFLRFTIDPDRDIKRGASLWFLSDAEYERRVERGETPIWIEDVGMYAIAHSGLSGHHLKAETVEEAIAQVTAKESWFGNSGTDSWAIFEGKWSSDQDTPEGNTFNPTRVAYFRSAPYPKLDRSL